MAVKLQYTDELSEEIAKIDKQCEDSVEEFCQTIDLKKEQEIQKIEEDKEIQHRKALEDSEQEITDYQNKLKGKNKVNTTELKKHYQQKYNKPLTLHRCHIIIMVKVYLHKQRIFLHNLIALKIILLMS